MCVLSHVHPHTYEHTCTQDKKKKEPRHMPPLPGSEPGAQLRVYRTASALWPMSLLMAHISSFLVAYVSSFPVAFSIVPQTGPCLCHWASIHFCSQNRRVRSEEMAQLGKHWCWIPGPMHVPTGHCNTRLQSQRT